MAEVYDDKDFEVTDPVQREIILARNAGLLDFSMGTAGALVEAGLREDQAVCVVVGTMLRTAAALAASVAMDFHGRAPERARWDAVAGAAFDKVVSIIEKNKAPADAG